MARRGRLLADLGISAPLGRCTHIGVGVRRDRFSTIDKRRRRCLREPAHGLGEQPRAIARRGRLLADLGISAPFGLCTHIGVGVRRDRFSKAQPLRRRWETAHPRQATHGARPGFAYSERDIPGRFGYAAESRCAAAAGSRIVGIPRICGRLSADSHAQEAPRDPRGCSDDFFVRFVCLACADPKARERPAQRRTGRAIIATGLLQREGRPPPGRPRSLIEVRRAKLQRLACWPDLLGPGFVCEAPAIGVAADPRARSGGGRRSGAFGGPRLARRIAT